MDHQVYYISCHRPKVLPLTEENVSRIGEVESSMSLLTRYCKETVPSLHTRRRRKREPSSNDFVMESPRLLSFPYHNDSTFLPTAEQACFYPVGSPSASIVSFSSSSCFSSRPPTPTSIASRLGPTSIKPNDQSSTLSRNHATSMSDGDNSKKLSGRWNNFRRVFRKSDLETPHWLRRLWTTLHKKKRKRSVSTCQTEVVWYNQYPERANNLAIVSM